MTTFARPEDYEILEEPGPVMVADASLAVLTRIAVAVEQIALELANRPQAPALAPLPPVVRVTGPSAPQPVAPLPTAAAPNSVGWGVGAIHAEGHKPLKSNAKGLYCPTKLADGSWCQFKA